MIPPVGAVVIGGYVNGLGLVRALAARGVRVAVVTTKPYDIAHRSRFVCGHDEVPDLETRPEQLVERLEARAREWSGWALYPTDDAALYALAQHHDRLAALYRVIAPPWEVARFLLDKQSMLAAAQEVGIDVPRCYGVADERTLLRTDLCFPVVVKPFAGYRFAARFGAKLFVADDRAALRRQVETVLEAGVPCGVYDLVPGPDRCIYAYCTYVDSAGEARGGLTVRKLRQSPPLFGVARVAEMVPDIPALREATIALLRRIGFRGMAAAEFKLDERSGKPVFMEVNGRSVIYNGLLRRAGLDLAWLAYADRVLGQPERAVPNGWPGVWVNAHADLLHSLVEWRSGSTSFGDFLAPYRRPLIDAVWSSADPVPFAAQWLGTARRGVAAVWRGKPGELTADRTRPT